MVSPADMLCCPAVKVSLGLSCRKLLLNYLKYFLVQKLVSISPLVRSVIWKEKPGRSCYMGVLVSAAIDILIY